MELFCLKLYAGVGSPERKFGFIEGFIHSLEEDRMSSRFGCWGYLVAEDGKDISVLPCECFGRCCIWEEGKMNAAEISS